ncbi:DUF899 domain-containing protein [Streptomyces sp. XM83C]|jgi:predicted dithiol-disulfide oxidoreductase (DUF899 family)|uniref:DUF899 domain-containing protein n=1 Tax=Streptomyces thermocoprophilus TaxID=78356 RepID=A0ABV5VMZ1_9ACTN|nr:DUF899 domain-containing protein [Streptomyces sp. XM83C]MCK1819913.1 DUF899 domain-containing protein [Streptomyces sp. XM83C]
MSLPEIVSREQWRAARESLLAKEKELTRAREALNAERRRLPMVEIEEEYVFEGGDGKATLWDLFEGRDQLVVHHFVFAPEADAGCPGCAAFLDQIGHLAHLHARGTSFVVVSRAPYPKILPFKARMGWALPWYSSGGTDFDRAFGAPVERGGERAERAALSCFLRDRDRIFHTYTTYGRGLDALGSATSLLDLTALGRREEWEEPRGRASALGTLPAGGRIRYHDEYDL